MRDFVLDNPQAIGSMVRLAVPTSDDIDLLIKGLIDRNLPESDRLVSNKELGWLDHYTAQGRVHTQFAWALFTSGDSREPEMAGLSGAFVGSLLTILVTLAVSFPIGVMARYIWRNWLRKTASPALSRSISTISPPCHRLFSGFWAGRIYQLFPNAALGAAGRRLGFVADDAANHYHCDAASLASIPPSIREAALGVGASRLQVIFHHVLPLAMPGILTGNNRAGPSRR